MQIYFVRHGKTEWNLASRFQGGHGDSPLLPQSLKDIKKLGKHLKGTKFRAIFASPLDRAFNTAQGIDDAMNANLPVIIDERLREFNLGDMEGMKFADAKRNFLNKSIISGIIPKSMIRRNFMARLTNTLFNEGKTLPVK